MTDLTCRAKIYLSIFLVSFCLFFPLMVSAETVSLYGNIDDSSSQANLLVDLMVNDPSYDPAYEYNILRAGQYDYRIYFGPDLDTSDSICLQYTPAYQTVPAQLSRYSVNNLSIIQNGYIYAGNTPGSARSSLAATYSFQQIVIIIASFLAIVIGFFVFRKKFKSQVKGYRL